MDCGKFVQEVQTVAGIQCLKISKCDVDKECFIVKPLDEGCPMLSISFYKGYWNILWEETMTAGKTFQEAIEMKKRFDKEDWAC